MLAVQASEVTSLLADSDPDVRCEAEAELAALQRQMASAAHNLVLQMLPVESDDERDIVLEVRAGTGGQEAGLFAGELFDMYAQFAGAMQISQVHACHHESLQRERPYTVGVNSATSFYSAAESEQILGHRAESQGWRFSPVSKSSASFVATVSGSAVYSTLKFENGVHRIQRVPATESKGRVHTSTATVLVLPQTPEADVSMKEADVEIETMRAGGAGGQHVNTTDSAVRATHRPTGIVVTSSVCPYSCQAFFNLGQYEVKSVCHACERVPGVGVEPTCSAMAVA